MIYAFKSASKKNKINKNNDGNFFQLKNIYANEKKTHIGILYFY
jgi:hypothetical protein